MPRDTPVRAYMNTDVLTFAPEDNVQTAMQTLVDRGFDGAPVVDGSGAVVGMLTTGDLIVQESQLHFPTVLSFLGATLELPSSKKHFDEDIRRALGASVGEVMSVDPQTIREDDTLEQAATLMHDHDVSRLPVVRAGLLVGIISRTDIVRAIVAEPRSPEEDAERVTVRATRAEVDAGAIAHNVSALARLVAPAELCVVVKADGYGHGAVGAARAALAAGATRLAVALTEEGAALRAAAIEAPLLLLSEPPPADAPAVIRARLEPAVYTEAGITALAAAASADDPLPVHLKVDTGMHRVGCRPADATRLAKEIAADGRLRLASVWTHLAVADEPDEPYTGVQLAAYRDVLRVLESAGIGVPLRHAANSAGAIAHPDARFDMVRCGIAVYGIPPSPALAGSVDLQPALRLVSAVSLVKVVEEGASVSYGRRYRAERSSVIATVPLGYADGVRRSLGAAGGEVLIRGRRRPIAGTVTMDQLMVDCGDDETVAVGDEVVLIGRQGDDEVPATEWAERLDTIGYEIVCGIGPRVPRHWTGDDR